MANSYQVYVVRRQLDGDWNLSLSIKVSGEKPIGQMCILHPIRCGGGKGVGIMLYEHDPVDGSEKSQKRWHSKVFFLSSVCCIVLLIKI